MGSETVRMIEELEGPRGSTSINEMTLGAARSNCRLQHCGVHRLSVGSLTRSG